MNRAIDIAGSGHSSNLDFDGKVIGLRFQKYAALLLHFDVFTPEERAGRYSDESA